jgi:hypothetical protein
MSAGRPTAPTTSDPPARGTPVQTTAARRAPIRPITRALHAHEAHEIEENHVDGEPFSARFEKHRLGGYVSRGATPTSDDHGKGGGDHSALHAHEAHEDFAEKFAPHPDPKIGGYVSVGQAPRRDDHHPG